MDILNPIYTERSRCQDCYKCVRNCPVKAITIEEGNAKVEPDLCILCGNCVKICPRGAKKVRDDISRAEALVNQERMVIASLAPSFISEFPCLSEHTLITALKDLGFSEVSETALGAEEVSRNVAELLTKERDQVLISSTCPSVVELIKKYIPEHGAAVLNMLSPVLAQCKILRERYGQGIGIVFVGPCIAKKREADQFPDLLDVALTFREFRSWLEKKDINLEELQKESNGSENFVPYKAREGALYPLDGGMMATIKSHCPVDDVSLMNFSGIKNITDALHGLEKPAPNTNLFLELLACEGGCINGPGCSSRQGTVKKRLDVLLYVDVPEDGGTKKPVMNISAQRMFSPVEASRFSPTRLLEALQSVGKYTLQDEINCSGCGYDTCRDFAAALLSGRAEKTMCVSYMRSLAQKKANSILSAMPSAALIIDAGLKILECNRKFASLLGEELQEVFDSGAGLEGAELEKLVPFSSLFSRVLKEGQAIVDRDFKIGDSVLNITVFPIEPQLVVGGIIQDITEPAVQKEKIISRAEEVIRKNLSTAQQIASLLGENAADSESILNSIIKTFKPTELNDGSGRKS
jgi:iron only hydrogenase large subunit-like protein